MRNFWIAFFILTASIVMGAPRNPNPTTPNQIWQNDQDLRDDIRNTKNFLDSKTLAQFKVTTPLKKGLMYFCSDCANALVCIATGTTKYGFSNMQAANRTTVCN